MPNITMVTIKIPNRTINWVVRGSEGGGTGTEVGVGRDGLFGFGVLIGLISIGLGVCVAAELMVRLAAWLPASNC